MKFSVDILRQKEMSCYIIAEVGINHNGKFKLANKMIEEASKTGVDAVKFQNFRTEDFIFNKSLQYTYKSQGKEITESMWDLCKRSEMKREWLLKLKELCDKLGVVFMSTPTSESGVNDLVNIGIKVLKNGSDYLSHLPLLKHMGSTNLPVIISTGMAYESEIKEAVEAVQSSGNSPIFLLHCTSAYPTEASDVNLRRMVALKKAFNLPVGFSDHTIGSSAAVQSVTLGACVIEKHFTLDHNMAGPDHWFSLIPSELKKYVKDIREAEKRMGSEKIEPSKGEKINRNEYRLSLIAVNDISQGQALKREDFSIAKPGSGLPPKESEKIIGKKLAKDIKKGSPLKWEHFK